MNGRVIILLIYHPVLAGNVYKGLSQANVVYLLTSETFIVLFKSSWRKGVWNTQLMFGLFFNYAIMLNVVASFNPQINYWPSFSFSFSKYLKYLYTLVVLESFTPLTDNFPKCPNTLFSTYFHNFEEILHGLGSYYKEAWKVSLFHL